MQKNDLVLRRHTHEVFRIPERFSKKNTKTKCGYECVYGRKEEGPTNGAKEEQMGNPEKSDD